MKTPFVLLILLGGAALNPAQAQSPPQAPASDSPVAAGHSPAEVVAMLGRRLALSEAQKSQILPIIAGRRQQIQAIHGNLSLPPRQKMSQVQGIMKDSDAKINALLTPEQQQGYAQIEQEMRAQMRAHREQGSAAGTQ